MVPFTKTSSLLGSNASQKKRSKKPACRAKRRGCKNRKKPFKNMSKGSRCRPSFKTSSHESGLKNEEENSEGEDADLAKTMRPECQLTLRSGAYIPERQPSEKEKSKVKGRGKEHEDGGETSEKPKFTVGDYKVVAHLRKILALLSGRADDVSRVT